MKILKGIAELNTKPRDAYVTIGNFDGVHLGHRSIISDLVQRARGNSSVSIVFTFRPHPQVALNPNVALDLITTYDEKLKLLAELSPDFIIEQPFSREFSNLSAEHFFEEIIVQGLGAKYLSVGYDFGFGKGRQGSIQFLRERCTNNRIELNVVRAQSFHGELCSSSRIREYIRRGDVIHARQLLGRPFFYEGIVVKGDGRGNRIGYPTANILFPPKIMIATGVYAVRVYIKNQPFYGLTNVGSRPTFITGGHNTVETHILGFSKDLYGELLRVEFLARIRDEMKFENKDNLITQIQNDINTAQQYFLSQD